MSSSATATGADVSTTTTSTTTPWVERYRPKDLTEVAHQHHVVQTLQNAVSTGRLPHLLLYGPPGTGKTSVALALCRQLWSPDQWRRRVLELNASDERGISVVRDKIKHFASLTVNSSSSGMSTTTTTSKKRMPTKMSKAAAARAFFANPSEKAALQREEEQVSGKEKGSGENTSMEVEDYEKKYPNPPFKIIILDEADTVTSDAQAALRRIIEAHSRITRFILICNYVTRIIEPLASRCAKFRFHALPPESMKARLHAICDAEGCSKSVLVPPILELAQGDMRRAVTMLQTAHAASIRGALEEDNDDDDDDDEDDQKMATTSSSSTSARIKDELAELAGLPPPRIVTDVLMKSWTNFDTMKEAVEQVCADGYSVALLLQILITQLVVGGVVQSQGGGGGGRNKNDDHLNLSDLSKSKMAIAIAQAEKNLIDGADEELQLLRVCSLALKCKEEDSMRMKH